MGKAILVDVECEPPPPPYLSFCFLQKKEIAFSSWSQDDLYLSLATEIMVHLYLSLATVIVVHFGDSY